MVPVEEISRKPKKCPSDEHPLSLSRRESSMKGLLSAIVVVQLVCHAPRTGLNIYEMVLVG